MKNLKEIFEKYGLNLSENQQNQFDLYFHNLVETNKVMNLTAITEEDEVLVKHFLDSALPEKFIPNASKIVDVGSGAGFPAIPLKIVRPDLEICMVDSLNKRINFLNEQIQTLKLTKTQAIHARAEEFAVKNREKFDVAVARAVAPLNTLTEYLLPLVKIGGFALIYKSTKLEEEIQTSKKAIETLGGTLENIEEMKIEGLERNILIIRKVKSCPTKYPRGQNKPRTNPII